MPRPPQSDPLHCESSGASPTGPRCPLLAPQVPRGHRALQMERRPTKLKATGNTPGQSWPLRKRQQQTCKLLTCKLLSCKLLSLESAPRLRRVPRPLLASHLAWRRAREAWRRRLRHLPLFRHLPLPSSCTTWPTACSAPASTDPSRSFPALSRLVAPLCQSASPSWAPARTLAHNHMCNRAHMPPVPPGCASARVTRSLYVYDTIMCRRCMLRSCVTRVCLSLTRGRVWRRRKKQQVAAPHQQSLLGRSSPALLSALLSNLRATRLRTQMRRGPTGWRAEWCSWRDRLPCICVCLICMPYMWLDGEPNGALGGTGCLLYVFIFLFHAFFFFILCV